MKSLKSIDDDENYNFIEHIEYADHKMNIKKMKSRTVQNNENILDLIKSWNKLKLESKQQDVKTRLIIRKKSVEVKEKNYIF